jgi:epoxide hydrolase-like predicted phosphatase
MTQAVKNVIFDIGNVVLEWQPEHILRSVFSVSNMEAMMAKTFLSREWQAYDQGMLSTKELKEQMALNVDCSITAIEALLQNVAIALRPIPEMIALIGQLKELGYNVYALSNMPSSIFQSLFEEHKFWHLFDDIIISSQVKLAKPDPEIYQFLLDKHSLAATDCIFLDDNKINVAVAKSLGIHGIKVINFQQAIDDLSDFLQLPKSDPEIQ